MAVWERPRVIQLAFPGRGTNRALLAVSAILGILAGLLGAYHGYGEVLQGNAVPQGIVISAWGGSGCVPEPPTYCFPAMTIIPAPFIVSGILSIIVGLIILVTTAMIVRGKWKGTPLLILSIILLLAGGGFFPPIFGVMGALVGLRASEREVRNLRAAGKAAIRQGLKLRVVTAFELAPEEATTVLRSSLMPYLQSRLMGRLIHSNFRVSRNSSTEEWNKTARLHPVFDVRESVNPRQSEPPNWREANSHGS
jgi:hypothetical protein